MRSFSIDSLIYEGYKYRETLNKSFLDKKMVFRRNGDSLIFNQKLPFNFTTGEVVDKGIFMNCFLKKGQVYQLRLKHACTEDIPSEFNSYYTINTVRMDSVNCSKFNEVVKNTEFKFLGNYGMYLDSND